MKALWCRWVWLALVPAPWLAAAPAGGLAVVNVTLHQYDGGPALAGTHVFVPGETVFFTFQVSGFRVSDQDQVKLTYQVEALDSQGIRLAEPIQGKFEVELTPQDKGWLPKARHEVTISPFAGSGRYRLAIAVKDELGGSEAKQESPFLVEGRTVAPSDKLAVRNFRFLRSEEDGQPLAVAAYRPGDVVWARFEITGYKIGEKNRFQIAYGLAVLSPSGKTLFTQPEAAREQKEPFYPQRWTPGILSLNPKPDTKPGEYTIVLTVRDLFGNQTDESRHAFRVE